MNDDLLKNGGKSSYCHERYEMTVGDICSSEKVFYRKVLDIFSTSVDYDSKSQIC